MKVFRCPTCRTAVVFQNTQCLSCGSVLHFDPVVDDFVESGSDCANRASIYCNWTTGPAETGFCHSCAMTEVIPDTFHGDNVVLWAEAELSKRRVLTNLSQWGWLSPADPGAMPRFHMLSEESRRGEHRVVMSHTAGLITINVTESDIVERVERSVALGEQLRTMEGHFRHEIAHFLFDRLSEKPGFSEAFRAMMGDERADYGAALARYYENGPVQGRHAQYITQYASAHPHEDWAETVTHLMHLTAITDSAVAVGWRSTALSDPDYDVYRETDVDRLLDRGSYVAMAVNHINRAIGIGDIYSFVLTGAVRKKLAFAHHWLSAGP